MKGDPLSFLIFQSELRIEMQLVKNPLIGKEVLMYPSDTYKKIALIKDISDLGFTFEILESEDKNYKIGATLFYNHAKPLILEILN